MHIPKRRKARKPSIAIIMFKVAPMLPRPSNAERPGITCNIDSSNHTTPVKNPRKISKMLHVECPLLIEVHPLSKGMVVQQYSMRMLENMFKKNTKRGSKKGSNKRCLARPKISCFNDCVPRGCAISTIGKTLRPRGLFYTTFGALF
jgi:hypothetical protein